MTNCCAAKGPLTTHTAAEAFLKVQTALAEARGSEMQRPSESLADPRTPETVGGGGRRLLWQQDLLDGFRRGWQRGDCANTVSSEDPVVDAAG